MSDDATHRVLIFASRAEDLPRSGERHVIPDDAGGWLELRELVGAKARSAWYLARSVQPDSVQPDSGRALAFEVRDVERLNGGAS